jgi:D-hexose-6-phosphate mutarotase
MKKMELYELKSVKIDAGVKTRLDAIKKGHSYSEFIEIMLHYFEVTNISPESLNTLPGSDIRQAVERVIKIQKAQEKDKFDVILRNVREIKEILIKNFNNSKQNITIGEANPVLEESLTAEDFETICIENVHLNERIKQLETEKGHLQIAHNQLQKENLTLQMHKAGKSIDVISIQQTLDSLRKHIKGSTYQKGHLEVDTTFFNACMDRITNELNK